MELDVYEQTRSLVFERKKFFWQIGDVRINIPDWLSPGKTVVSQRALDNQYFEFRLDVTHPWLGVIFRQASIFK